MNLGILYELIKDNTDEFEKVLNITLHNKINPCFKVLVESDFKLSGYENTIEFVYYTINLTDITTSIGYIAKTNIDNGHTIKFGESFYRLSLRNNEEKKIIDTIKKWYRKKQVENIFK